MLCVGSASFIVVFTRRVHVRPFPFSSGVYLDINNGVFRKLPSVRQSLLTWLARREMDKGALFGKIVRPTKVRLFNIGRPKQSLYVSARGVGWFNATPGFGKGGNG